MASIRKRTWTTNGEAKTAWVADYFDQHGKRRLKTFAQKKAADAWLVDVRKDIKTGTHTADSASITVARAAEIWLRAVEAEGREIVGTLQPYERLARLHIVPFLGDQRLSRLTTPMVEKFKADLLQSGRSRAMTRQILGALKMMLNTAMRQGFAAYNPATAVQNLSNDRDKKRIQPPSKAEIGAIINAADGRWRPFIITAVFTGLRASELRGLRWIDVDLVGKNPTLTVNQRADQYGSIGRPKSNAGNRTIPLPPMAATALKEWQLASSSQDLVFPSPATGRAERLSNIVKTGYNPIQRRAGIIKPYGMHALRHFYASWLIEQGFSPKRIQNLMGHSSITMTYDRYGHLFPSLEDDHAKLAAAERVLMAPVMLAKQPS